MLFPSWAFFDVAGAVPTLERRRLLTTDATDVVDAVDGWEPTLTVLPRRSWQLLYSPAGTRMLAEQTLVERLYRELAESEADAQHEGATRALVRELAIARCPASWLMQVDTRWQWRIVLRSSPRDARGDIRDHRALDDEVLRETMQQHRVLTTP